MDKNFELKATMIDENGKEHIYKPYAFMAYEGDHFVVLRADDASDIDERILILRAESSEGGAVFNLVDEDMPLMKALYEGLGLSGYMLN